MFQILKPIPSSAEYHPHYIHKIIKLITVVLSKISALSFLHFIYMPNGSGAHQRRMFIAPTACRHLVGVAYYELSHTDPLLVLCGSIGARWQSILLIRVRHKEWTVWFFRNPVPPVLPRWFSCLYLPHDVAW